MASELSSLLDIVIGRGVKHSELMREIRGKVGEAYTLNFGKRAKSGVEILINEERGDVRLMVGSQDVTPEEFREVAASIARQIIIDRLQLLEQQPGREVKYIDDTPRGMVLPAIFSFNLGRLLAVGGFWGYNGLYGLFLLLMWINWLGNIQWLEPERGWLGGVVWMAWLSVIPVVSVWSVWKKRWFRSGRALARMFFLFELPTIVLSLMFQSLLAGSAMPVKALLGLILFLPAVLFIKSLGLLERWRFGKLAYLSWFEVLWLLLGYVCLLYGFYFVLGVGELWQGMWSTIDGVWFYDFGLEELLGTMVLFVVGGLYVGLALGVLSLPYWLLAVVTKRFYRLRLEMRSLYKETLVQATTVSVFVGLLVVTLLVSWQPNLRKYVGDLAAFSQTNNYEQRRELATKLLGHEAEIKQGLEDMYYSSSRYWWNKESMGLARSFERTFDMEAGMAGLVQEGFLILARPFVYQGPLDNRGQLTGAYTELFGETIREANTEDEVKDVRLVSREITVSPDSDGLLAKVTIDEVFENTTTQQEEVIYEFSLPEEAVMVDLKLGPDLEHQGQIAPRGAAQETYERQIQQRRDPALLEQTGPSQYRLRVFPVPGRNDQTTLSGRNQRVAFSYVVGATPEGYPLPVYSLEQNVNTKGSDIRPLTKDFISSEGGYVRAGLDMSNNPCDLVEDTLLGRASDGREVWVSPYRTVVDFPLPDCGDHSGLLPTVAGYSIAIAYDASYGHKDDVAVKDLQKLLEQNKSFLSNNQVYWYEFNSDLSKATRLGPNNLTVLDDVLHFGQRDVGTVLQKLPGSHDMLIVITGEDTFFNTREVDGIRLSKPVYLVHTEDIPAYTQKFTVKLLQQNGGLASSFEDAVYRHHLQRMYANQPNDVVVFGNYWAMTVKESTVVQSQEAMAPVPSNVDPGFGLFPSTQTSSTLSPLDLEGVLAEPVANRGLLLQQIDDYSGDLFANRSVLDHYQEFVEATKFVSPFSSYIALVNAQQQATLDQLSRQSNRYEEQEMIGQPDLGRMAPPVGMVSGGPLDYFFGMDISTSGDSAMMARPFGDGEETAISNPSVGDGLAIPDSKVEPALVITDSGEFGGVMIVIGSMVLIVLGGVGLGGVWVFKRLRRKNGNF